MRLFIIALLFAISYAQTVCYSKLSGGLPLDEGNSVGQSSGVSLDDCEQSCTRNPSCKSLSYTTKWNGLCFLKDKTLSPSTPTKSDPDFSGYYQVDCPPVKKQCYAMLQGGIPTNQGNEVGKTEGGSLLDCQTSCNQNSQCKSIVFTYNWNSLCFLKDRVLTPNTPSTPDVDFVSYFQTSKCTEYKWFGLNKVTNREFWATMRGVGFSPADNRAWQDWMKRDDRSINRLRDALKKAAANDYNMIRTWKTDQYEMLTMKSIVDLRLDIKIQLGIEIYSGTSDLQAFQLIDQACDVASYFPDLVLGFSLGNEQIGYAGMPPRRVIKHAQYAKRACDIPVSYNFAENDFWNKGSPNALVLINYLDYVNVHLYGGFDTSLSPSALLDKVKQQENERYNLFGKNVPMVIGETGYQVLNNGRSESQKGEYYSLITKYIYGTEISQRKALSMFFFELNNEDWKGHDNGWGIYNQGTADYIGNPGANFSPTKISDIVGHLLNITSKSTF